MIKTEAEKNAASKQNKFKKNSQLREVWRRLRKNKRAMIALGYIVFFFLVAICADFIADYQTKVVNQNLAHRLLTPSREYWFGTDIFGRDMFARIVHGARIAILMGFGATVVSIVTAALIGTSAAYFGRMADNIIMRIMDTINTIPSLLLCLAIVAGFGAGLTQLVVALAAGQIASFTRIIRSKALTVVNQEFIEAARALGAGNMWIIFRYVIPNVTSIILIQGAMNVSVNILLGATLSFVGLGAQVPTPEWGSMLKDGLTYMQYFPHLVVIPGICLMLTALSINTFGDCLRDAFDPRLKGKA